MQDRPYTREQFAALYYNEAMTITEIAEHFDIGRKIVQTDMRRFGIKARKPTPRNQIGSNNPNWKGDEVSYRGAHVRVRSQRGKPAICEQCGKPAKEWASVSKQHHNPSDFRSLCRSCHRKADAAINNIK